MRTLGVVLGTSGLAAAGLVATMPGASAASCSGSVLVSAGYVRLFGGSPVVGSIQLRRDSCHRYWGQLTMYEPTTAITVPATATSLLFLANQAATAASTTPSSTRSRVESRKAPKGVPLPDIRE